MSIEELNLEEFKKFTRKEKLITEVCQKFDISILEVWSIIHYLREQGINIIVSGKSNDATILNLDERNLKGDNSYTIDIENSNKFSTLVISDTRLGSKHQQLSLLNEAYLKAFYMGYTNVILLGDLTEGLYNKKNKYYNSLFLTSTDDQVDYVINNYPYVEGITTYFITGDQDLTHISKNGIDIGRVIANERDDMIYLGQMSCLINIRKIKILAQHLKIGAFDRAKTVSLKQQDSIASMRSEDKVDIILNGHLLTDEQMIERGMRELSIPSLVATTPRIKSNAVNHNVGFILLDCYFTPNGKLDHLDSTFAPYYQTRDNDYVKARTLKLTREGK